MDLKHTLLNVVIRYKTSIEHMTEDGLLTYKEYLKIVKRIDDRIKELTE